MASAISRESSGCTVGGGSAEWASKVPLATAAFWLAKIIATTVGEVGGNLVSMDSGLGYLAATAVLGTLFLALASVQVAVRRFHPAVYWSTIVASTTAGTTLADYVTRSIGLGYAGGSLLLFALVLASLASWRWAVGRVSADDIASRRAELFYWVTITFSQTLGTALGDWFADSAGFGYSGSALIFGAALLLLLLLHYRRSVNGVILFWAAFILTRPLGAVVGNLFDKPVDHGGLALSRHALTLAMLALMVTSLILFPTRAKFHRGRQPQSPGQPCRTGW